MEYIRNEIKDNINVIYLVGQINTSNADAVEKEINEAIKENSGFDVVLNCENLTYISSSGLRILLRLVKKNPSTKLVDVVSDVYEIFEMTGFSEIMTIEKAFRKLSVDGCTVIGEGAKGIVYRLDEDTIIKYYKDSDSLPAIKKERELARRAFISGVPTAIPYDVVKIGDSYGSVFELLNATSLTACIKNEPEKYDHYISDFANLLKTIHNTEVNNDILGDAKKFTIKKLVNIKPILSDEIYDKLYKMIEDIPESSKMIHGDYHSNNILMQNGEALLIDMDTLSFGHPIFELYHTFVCYKGFSETDPAMTEDFLKMEDKKANKMWDDMLRKYFDDKSEDEIIVIEDKIKTLAYLRIVNHYYRRGMMDNPKGKETIMHYLNKMIKLVESLDNLEF